MRNTHLFRAAESRPTAGRLGPASEGAPVSKKLLVLMLVGSVLMPLVTTPKAASGEPSSSSPQAVIDWSTIAHLAIVGMAGKFPGEAAVLMGIAHVAIYDAVTAIEGGAEPYAVKPQVPPGASAPVAAAAAGHGVLVGLLPDLRPNLDDRYEQYLAGYPDGPAKAGGVAVGEEAAAGILAIRKGDGRDEEVPYEQAPTGPGVFEPTAPFPPLGTNLGRIEPLTLPTAALFTTPGPPQLGSARYAADMNEVAVRGREDSTARTQEETAVARFWTDHGVPQWNRALFRLINQRGLRLAEAARLLAMAHTGGADAMIACFAAKYEHRFWRPIHAIPRADTDGNDQTRPDVTWRPLLRTPNHPEYPAAHGCHSSAVTAAVAAFFGTERVATTIDSFATGETRHYDRLSSVTNEIIDARILGGVHYRFSGEDGATLGSRVGRFAATSKFTRTMR